MTTTSRQADPHEGVAAAGPRAARSRLWRGRPDDPAWVRPALLALLAATFAGYLWNLSASGYANSFYSAAVQAGSQSWKAFFFGSLDAANAITVDKPPASLWPMALSVRLFGLGSWQILLPEVLMGVGTVAVLYAAVRRRFSPAAGLIAGAVLALTPVAALMFRFNNPDALLALLMTVTVYCVLRALEEARTKWLVWAGVAIGFAFLTKTLQAFLILPPLALLYSVCAPTSVRRRLGQLALSTGVLIVSGGWWVAAVELWPKSSRPYIGGSQHNSFLELTFGYNGLGRINGDETGSVGGGAARAAGGMELPAGMRQGGGGGGGGGWGATGIGRMFNSEIGSQISWLLPAALLLLIAGLVVTWRAKRTDTARAAFLAWGGALLMTAVIFSFMAGIFHQYYTVALSPYVAALVGMGVTVLWEERSRLWAALALGLTVAVTAVWSYVLLGRTPDYLPWLRWAVLIGGLATGMGLALASRLNRRAALGVAGVGLVASLAGPAAYSVSTLNTGHTGSIVTAGPAGASVGGPGGGGRMRFGGGANGGRTGGQNGGQNGGWPGRGASQGQGQGQGMPGGGMGQAPTAPGQTGLPGGGAGERGGMRGMGGGMGGLLDGAKVSAEAEALLEKDAGRYTWAAAAIGSQNAASYQLATEKPVMAIGGFNGSDPSPTLEQFKKYVADGKIHYFISSGGGMMGGGGGEGRAGGSAISSWVESSFKKVTVGTATFYDLTVRVS
ncbi:ArnT family glycosyltransferase [Streptomyces sp. WM6378]|uniref:ArnT family glycosyltransferase n=1 Tax=Streptomyces sp. WM6378 TaxID=1415557 RepID=UPI0006AEC07E|nr:glycosyltransferase family 39 protein [Streptomyces sp. WM6378]KOU46809.1 glycosyl transferase [Streptomyces sp. WM6378]